MGTQVKVPIQELTEFDLPRVCVVTGETERVAFHDVSFQYIPPSARMAAAFCGPIGYIVAMAFMRKTASGKLPFADAAHARYKQMRIILPLVLVVAIVAAVLVFALGSQEDPSLMLPMLVVMLVVIVGGAIGMTVGLKAVGPVAVLIDETHVTLELPSADAARAFEERLHAPRDPGSPPGPSGGGTKPGGRDALDDELDAELKA